jgi:beta-glucanase (GH16 family)
MKLLALAPLALLLTPAAAFAQEPPAGAAQALSEGPIGLPEGYRLVWADEFKGSGLPDERKWAYDTAFNKKGWFNEEKQYYSARRSKNARLRDGRLIIEAHAERLDPKKFPDWGGQAYTSARLFTRGKASWKYGYFESRAKLPCGLGTWPAIWTLSDGANTKWPDDGEIDIMEHVAQDPGTVHQTIHTDAFNHVDKTQKTATRKVPDACTAFHTYQLLWTPTSIRMGIDGRELFRFDKPSGKYAEWPFDRPHYLLLNLAIGGWGGLKGIDDKALPQKFEVDYVRVYQAK